MENLTIEQKTNEMLFNTLFRSIVNLGINRNERVEISDETELAYAIKVALMLNEMDKEIYYYACEVNARLAWVDKQITF